MKGTWTTKLREAINFVFLSNLGKTSGLECLDLLMRYQPKVGLLKTFEGSLCYLEIIVLMYIGLGF